MSRIHYSLKSPAGIVVIGAIRNKLSFSQEIFSVFFYHGYTKKMISIWKRKYAGGKWFPTNKNKPSRFAYFETFSLNFSSSPFVIRISLLHPWPSLFLHDVLFIFWCFFIVVNYYFHVFFNLKVILYAAKITQNTVAWAPLRSEIQMCLLTEWKLGRRENIWKVAWLL